MTVAFYASGKATRLRKLLQAWTSLGGSGLAEIAFVLIDHDRNADLRGRCGALSIPCFELPLQSFPKERRNRVISDYLLEKLEEMRADWALIFGNRILKGPILSRFENRIINFHPSLLPEFPGLLAIDQALRAGAPELGNTAHVVTEHVDAGPVLLQSRIDRADYRAYDDVLDLQIPMAVQILTWLRDGRIRFQGDRATVCDARPGGRYCPGIEIDEERVMRSIGS
jgi:phosphoribosylglycinamide formyltransferase-1